MQYNNLVQALEAVKEVNDRGITFIEGAHQEEFLSYAELYASALKMLAGLQKAGVKPKDELVLQIDNNKIFITVFWACILGGIIPVPLSIGQTHDHKQKVFNIWPILNRPYLITSPVNFDRLDVFASLNGLDELYADINTKYLNEDDILSYTGIGEVFNAQKDDIAFVQFSSGSTGNPKGVVLRHGNLLTNMAAISKAAGYSSQDSTMSWMPLTHDMGLIGFHLNPLVMGMNQYLIPTSRFIRHPALWLEKASSHKVNILCSPNFGYEYVLKHCKDLNVYNWKLSHVRIIYNGAEPISAILCNHFLDKLSKADLKRNAMCPVYGLAEASLAVSVSGIEDDVMPVHVNRYKVNVTDHISLEQEGPDTITFVNVGRAVEQCAIRIADNDNNPLDDETIGHIQIKGDGVTSGYYNDAEQTANVFAADGWLKTGDLGFIRNGSLYVTGRAKDIIFSNGQNYYPHDIERIAESVDGIELNKIAVAGFFNSSTQKEEAIAFIFHRGDIESFVPVSRAVKAIVNAKTGLELFSAIPVKEMPRTTSGKLQRFKLLEQYREGRYDAIIQQLNNLMSEWMDTTDNPVTATEQKLLEIWQYTLRKQTIGITENFFEIGGNSLHAASMSMLVLKELGVDLPLEVFYEKKTIRALAGEIDERGVGKYLPIPVIQQQGPYPASPSQKRIFYFWEINKSSVAYNIPAALRIKGEVNIARLEFCVKQLIVRHDTLRMSFRMGSIPEFIVHNNIDFHLGYDESDEHSLKMELLCSLKVFNLAEPPLFNITLFKINQQEYILLLDFHHIISDGISVYNFIDELFDLYAGKNLTPLPVQYKDYAVWEKLQLQSEKIKTREEYWLKQFNDEIPVLEMPLDFQRPPVFTREGGKIEFFLSEEITHRLKTIATENDCTLHVVMFALYNILLSKYTGQEDLVVGIPVSGRRHPDLLNMQGMFVNNLAVRNQVNGKASFLQFLQTTRSNINEALKHQDYPFDNLVTIISQGKNAGRNPVFDTMFIYQNMQLKERNDELSFSPYYFDPGFSKFDISFEVFDNINSLKLGIEYSKKLFARETVSRMADHFNSLIQNVLINTSGNICDLSVISSRDEMHVKKFNDTQRSYPKTKTIHQLFEEQCTKTPLNVSIEDNGLTLTYEQLNEKADRLAALISEIIGCPNKIVAIFLKRSGELVVSILAVLKAGHAYLPIDSDWPDERIEYIIADSKCSLVITDTPQLDRIKNSTASMPGFPVINVEKELLKKATQITHQDQSITNAPAYVIYTSGTTGRPKGVVIEHVSLVNYCCWAARRYVKDDVAAFPLYTSIAFDLTVTSVFTPLITGNKIVVYNENGKDLLIEKIITDRIVNIIKLTPSHLRLLLDKPMEKGFSVKRFIVGGEQLETQLTQKIYNQFNGQVEIYNEYGPTETTVGCMIHQFDPAEQLASVPIGIPADNVQIYILDRYLKPVPVGVRGELYISGDGVGRGYLFNDELTKEKFIPDCFLPNQRMYKTGDISRRLPNGIIEFIGRSDHQVKINGYRIELGEIESYLNNFPGVTAAVAVVRTNKDNQRHIYAYYKSETAINEVVIWDYLAGKLPHFMIPAFLIHLQAIPLTKNGKVNHDALPVPEAGDKKTVLPKNDLEEVSLKIWKDVLNEADISVTDNFFELGGDSIKAAQISFRLLEQGIAVSANNILIYHTIERICSHAKITGQGQIYEQGIVQGEINLSPVAAWFFNQHFNNPNYYNQSVLLCINQELHFAALEQAFTEIVRHHDGLRLNYNPEKHTLFFNDRYLNKTFPIEIYELKDDDPLQPGLSGICQQIKSSLDITSESLLKAAVIQRQNTPYALLITAHHLIMDGVSWRIFMEDLYALYNSFKTGEAPRKLSKTASLSYWEKSMYEYAASDSYNRESRYWDEIDDLPFIIPQDHETNEWQEKNASRVRTSLNKQMTDYLLKDANKVYNTNPYILLNTALALILKEWTGWEVMIIEQESHGRNPDSIATARTIGWFTAIFPARIELANATIGKQIIAVKEQLRNIPGDGIDYGIRKYIAGSAPQSERKITQVRFNYLGQFNKEFNNNLFSYCMEPHGSESDPANLMTAKLEIDAMVIDEQLIMDIRYNRKAHEQQTINWLKDMICKNLMDILEHIQHADSLHFSTSDFVADLDQEELDTLFR